MAALVEDKEPNFWDLMVVALDNPGINPQACLQTACNVAPVGIPATPHPYGPVLIDANGDEIVYKLTFDLPDAGLHPVNGPPGAHVPPAAEDAAVEVPNQNEASEGQRHPLQS
jgi:hypothetical protein